MAGHLGAGFCGCEVLQYELHDQMGGSPPPIFYGQSLKRCVQGRWESGASVLPGKTRFFEQIFVASAFLRTIDVFRKPSRVALQQTVETTVAGLGYDLVEIERSAGGLLRVTIDWPWVAGQAERLITVEDCEIVTRQLQFALEVDGADYNRLEVASPGIDRPLRHVADFERFLGYEVDVTLKEPIGVDVAAGKVSPLRKKFRGTLEKVPAANDGEAPSWQVVWRDVPEGKPGQRISAKRLAAAPVHALGFVWDELRDARLAPIVNFKGRQSPDGPPDDSGA